MSHNKNIAPNRPLVIVEWVDSQSSSGWHHEDDLNEDYELPLVYSTGFIIQETEEFVCVIQSMIFYSDVSSQTCGTMTIPRGCIRKIVRLRRGGEYVSQSG